METQQTIDRNAYAEAVRKSLSTKLDTDKTNEIVNQILAADISKAKKYRADGQIASISAYTAVNCDIRDGKKFRGNAGAVPAVCVGIWTGEVYTDNLDRLYNETHAFEFHIAVFYFGITFFDKNSNLLGHFESGGIANCINEGGGTGSWT